MIAGRRGFLLAPLAALAASEQARAATGAEEANSASAVSDPVRRGRVLRFPRDHGAHLGSRIEWWYATGWLRAEGSEALLGFQITFFRSATSLAQQLPGRLAPRHLLFAHAAVSDVAGKRHLHADRIARWSGQDLPDMRHRASSTDADLALAGWTLRRTDDPQATGGSRYDTELRDDDFTLQLKLRTTQALLLQGEQGFSRKGPQESQASHYTSETQVAASGLVTLAGRSQNLSGRAWIDHEWSDELLHPQAVGWDWIGINLDGGHALTAFQLRRADGSVLWAGGSFRAAGQAPRSFAPNEVQWLPGRRWRSPGSNAEYPVEWSVQTPAGKHTVRALLDAQELDGRSSTGTVYWEGLSEVLDAAGRRVGLGYLEMTGYAGRLTL